MTGIGVEIETAGNETRQRDRLKVAAVRWAADAGALVYPMHQGACILHAFAS
jgi:hypothetical protein